MATRKRGGVNITVGGDNDDFEDLIEGGPGVAPAARTAGPQMVEIEISGVKYLVPAESAAAIKAQQESLVGEVTRTKAELEAAKAPPVKVAPVVQPVADDDDLENQLFLNPRAALAKFGENLTAKITQQVTESYTLDQQRKAWWDSFYGANKHLKNSPTIVEAVMNKHMNELKALPVDKQQAALAEKVDNELAEIVKTRAAAAPRESARPVEGGGAMHGNPRDTGPAETPDRVISIGEIQRNMRKRRMDARTGRASA